LTNKFTKIIKFYHYYHPPPYDLISGGYTGDNRSLWLNSSKRSPQGISVYIWFKGRGNQSKVTCPRSQASWSWHP
jgi:hypothetical protein